MQKSIRKGFSALTASAIMLSAVTCQMTAVQAADATTALLVTGESGSKEISFDLINIDVTAVDRIDASIAIDSGEANGCIGYNVPNPEATGDDDQFNWEQAQWSLKASDGIVSVDGLAGTMTADSPNFMFQVWWIQSFYDAEGEVSGDGSLTLYDITIYDADDNILGYFGTYEDALLTAQTDEENVTYNFNFTGIDATLVDRIEADMSVNTGYVNGAIGYTDTTIEVDPEDETSTDWVSAEQVTEGLYSTWSVEGLAGKLDAENPAANLQVWYVNPFYVYDAETEESTPGDPGTAQLMAVRYYDAEGNELVPVDITTSLLERTSDETGDTAYVIPFTGIDASLIDKIEAGVYVDSGYVNGCMGYIDTTVEVDPEDETSTNWVSVDCETAENYGTWELTGLAGKLDADYPSAQVQFWYVNPFYDKDSGEVDEDGNPIMEAGSIGTAKLVYVNLYDAEGNLITPVNTDDYLAKKYGNGEDFDGSSVAYSVDMTDIDATLVASMELFFHVDTGYVNGAVGYANADDEWQSINYDFSGNFGSVVVEGIDGGIPAGYAPQVQMWWVNENRVGTGEIDPETEEEITEYLGEGTAKLLSVILYDAEGNVLGINGLTEEELNPTPSQGEDIDPPAEIVVGDVNCDGAMKVNDVILLNRFLAEDKTIEITSQGLLNADCDGTAGVGGSDASWILKKLAALI